MLALARLAVAALAITAVTATGCSGSKGRKTSLTQAHNLVVDNFDYHYGIDVYVDGASLGSVGANGRGYFWVAPGLRSIVVVSDEEDDDGHFRRQDYGLLDFMVERELRLAYSP